MYQYAPPQRDDLALDDAVVVGPGPLPTLAPASPPSDGSDDPLAAVSAAQARLAGAEGALAAAGAASALAQVALLGATGDERADLADRLDEARFTEQIARIQRDDATVALSVARARLDALPGPSSPEEWVAGPLADGLVVGDAPPKAEAAQGWLDALSEDLRVVKEASALSPAQAEAAAKSGDDRARKLLAQLGAPQPDGEQIVAAVQGMNADEAKALYGRLAELEGFRDARAARDWVEKQCVVHLDPVQYGVATASLSGNRIESAKASLRRAAADPEFRRASSRARGEAWSDLSLEEQARAVDRRLPSVKELTDGAPISGLRALVDADEEGMVAVLEGLSQEELVRLANDDEFRALEPGLREVMKREGRLTDRWDRLTDTGPREKAIEAVLRDAGDRALAALPPDADPRTRDLAVAKARIAARSAEGFDQRVTAALPARWRGAELAEQLQLGLYGANRFGEEGVLDQGDRFGLDLDSDGARTRRALDAVVSAPPEVQEAFARRFARDLPDEVKEKYRAEKLTDAQIVERELGRELAGRKLRVLDAVPVLSPLLPAPLDVDGDAARLQWSGAGAKAEVERQRKALSNGLGEDVSTLRVHTWLATVHAGGPEAGALLRQLQARGVDLRALEELAAADRERRAADDREQAARAADAADKGNFRGVDGVFSLVEDRDLAEVDARIRALKLPGGRRTAEQELELHGLEAHRAALAGDQAARGERMDAAVAKATGGRRSSLVELVTRDPELAVRGQAEGFAARMRTLREDGTLPLEDWLYVATKGVGQDDGQLEKRLTGRAPSEIEAAGERFRARYGDEFPEVKAYPDGRAAVRALLEDQCSGGFEAKAKALAQGDGSLVFDPSRTYDPADRRRRAADRLEVERRSLQILQDAGDSGLSRLGAKRAEDAKDTVRGVLRRNEDALLAGDPAAWDKYLAAKKTSALALGIADDARGLAADQVEKKVTDAALEAAAMIPGLGPAAKAALALGGFALSQGARVAIQGDSADGEKAALGGAKALGAALLELVPGADKGATVLGPALEVLLDPALVDGGGGLGGRLLEAIALSLLAKELGGLDQRRDAERLPWGSFAASLSGLLPKVADGSLSWKDLQQTLSSTLRGAAAQRAASLDAWARLDDRALRAEVEQRASSGKGGLTDAEVEYLRVRGVDEPTLRRMGVSDEQRRRSRSTLADADPQPTLPGRRAPGDTRVDAAPPTVDLDTAVRELQRLQETEHVELGAMQRRLESLDARTGDGVEAEALRDELALRRQALEREQLRWFSQIPPEDREEVARRWLGLDAQR